MSAASIFTGIAFAGALAFAAFSMLPDRRAARLASALAALLAAPTGLVLAAPELGAALLAALAVAVRARFFAAAPAAVILCAGATLLSPAVGLAGLVTLSAWRANGPVTLAILAAGLLAIVFLLDGSLMAGTTFVASFAAAALLARWQQAAAVVPAGEKLAHAIRWGAVLGLAAFLALRDRVAPGASPPRAFALAAGATVAGAFIGAVVAGACVLLSTAGPARDVSLAASVAGAALAIAVGPPAILGAFVGAATLASVGLMKTYGALFPVERGPP